MGELVGISKISMSLFSVMVREAKRSFIHSFHVDYEVDCLIKASTSYPVYCHLVSDLIWSEIDNAKHLDHVQNSVYFDLLKKDGFQPNLFPGTSDTDYEKIGMEFLAFSQNYDASVKK